MLFKNNIKDKRIFRGLTQEELANQAGIHLETLRSFEQQRRNPSIESLFWVSKALGCKEFDLVSFDRNFEGEKFNLKKICKEEGVKVNDLLTDEQFKTIYCQGDEK